MAPGAAILIAAAIGWAGIVLCMALALALRPLDTAGAVLGISGVCLFTIVALVSLGAWLGRIVNTGPLPRGLPGTYVLRNIGV